MTFKLNPELDKLLSPVILIFPDGMRKEYRPGAKVMAAVFEQRYRIASLTDVDNTVEITLIANPITASNRNTNETFF
jgi:hypothetical protein